MFGLEKKERALFEFELEQDLRKDPLKAKELLKKVETRVQSIKSALRQGAESEDFEKLGALLQGYTGLQRVLTRIINKK